MESIGIYERYACVKCLSHAILKKTDFEKALNLPIHARAPWRNPDLINGIPETFLPVISEVLKRITYFNIYFTINNNCIKPLALLWPNARVKYERWLKAKSDRYQDKLRSH